ncbi:MAG: hypothetical protein LBU42_04155 [Prevotellaceae bacterium]|jgi:hypothetical protein|nr:hypothetical protein [Prevotellaceae bacterium]
MKTTTLLAAAIAPFLLAGCLGDPVEPKIKTAYVAIIVNNGAGRDGSVNYYFEDDGSIDKTPFNYRINATYRSIQMLNDRLGLVTNDDDAIVSFDIMGRILGSPKTDNIETPRFMAATANNIFVSNWGEETGEGEYNSSFVSVFNQYDYSFRKKLPCGSQPEGVLAYKDRLFVATAAGVEVFNTVSSDFIPESTITASSLTGNAKRFVVDTLENVWVSYANGGLLCFNPASRAIVHELSGVPVDAETGMIAVNKNGRKVISYTNTPEEKVVAIDISTGEQTDLINLSSDALVAWSYPITALGVSPFTGDIFVARTAPNGESTLLVYDETGKAKSETKTGIHTGHITFFGISYY